MKETVAIIAHDSGGAEILSSWVLRSNYNYIYVLKGPAKNIFFRNHKGNRHYLVILEHMQALAIRDLEQRLKQGKLSFASPKRMLKYLGVSPGSVSPFGLINDQENHTHLFLDENLKSSGRISFHPNINTASLVISFSDFEKFLLWTGNTFEYIKLYD